MALGTLLYTLLFGRYVGADAFGNRYYHAKSRHLPGHGAGARKERRWVIYRGEAEASKVPPVWHGWLHYITDEVPAGAGKRYWWQKDHLPNLTGTAYAYYPPGHPLGRAQRARATGDYIPWQPEAEENRG